MQSVRVCETAWAQLHTALPSPAELDRHTQMKGEQRLYQDIRHLSSAHRCSTILLTQSNCGCILTPLIELHLCEMSVHTITSKHGIMCHRHWLLTTSKSVERLT